MFPVPNEKNRAVADLVREVFHTVLAEDKQTDSERIDLRDALKRML
jgi:hypothetical protein